MELSGFSGGGIMLALGAGLWLVYLVPSWLKRREFDATERNAVRLQQTLRVLAETSEVPLPVRAETSARSVAEQQKVLKQQQAVMDAAARARAASAARTAAKELAAVQPSGVFMQQARASAATRLRRTRIATSSVLLASVVAALVQWALLSVASAAAPLVFGLAAAFAVTSLALLGRLSAVSRARASIAVTQAAPTLRKQTSRPAPVREAAPVAERSWTPVEVPKPLYLSRSQAPSVDAAAVVAELRAAAAQADQALRASEKAMDVALEAAHNEPEVSRIERAPSRFASMGIVEPTSVQTPDLDEVLRRRRASA